MPYAINELQNECLNVRKQVFSLIRLTQAHVQPFRLFLGEVFVEWSNKIFHSDSDQGVNAGWYCAEKKKSARGCLVTDLFKEKIRLQVIILLSEHFVSVSCSVVTFLLLYILSAGTFPEQPRPLSSKTRKKQETTCFCVCLCQAPPQGAAVGSSHKQAGDSRVHRQHIHHKVGQQLVHKDKHFGQLGLCYETRSFRLNKERAAAVFTWSELPTSPFVRGSQSL